VHTALQLNKGPSILNTVSLAAFCISNAGKNTDHLKRENAKSVAEALRGSTGFCLALFACIPYHISL